MHYRQRLAGHRGCSVLLALISRLSSSMSEERLAPVLGSAAFEKQRLFGDQRYPNVVVTTKGTVLAVWGNDGVSVRRSEDGGKSWKSVISVAEAGYHGGGTTVDAKSGDILIFVEDRQPPAPRPPLLWRRTNPSWNQSVR